MLKKILVPLDGSELSEEVIPLVNELLADGIEVTLFAAGEAPKGTRRRGFARLQPLPLTAMTGPTPAALIQPVPPSYVETKDQAVQREEQELLAYLSDAGRPLVKAGCPVHAAVHFGEAAREITAFAKKNQIDLIVMATHGRSGLRETLHGSVTTAVIRSGVAPVLVVRPKGMIAQDNDERARTSR